MADLNGWVGHHRQMGCHLMCGLPGHNKPGAPHYYPALLCPNNLHEDQVNCNHPDIDINNLPSASAESYHENLYLVIVSQASQNLASLMDFLNHLESHPVFQVF
jgi:hypothetical protein